MNTFFNNNFFLTWFNRSIIGTSLLICIILIIQYLFRKELTARWRYLLWWFVIIKILISLTPVNTSKIVPISEDAIMKNLTTLIIREPLNVKNLQVKYKKTDSRMDKKPIKQSYSAKSKISKKQKESEKSLNFTRIKKKIPLKLILYTLWLLGMIILFIRIIYNSLLSYRIKNYRPLTNSKFLNLLEDCKEDLKIKTPIWVIETSDIKSPSILGFVRPKILLPLGLITHFKSDELKFIIKHELAHIKRKDIIMNWILTILNVLYWFNPLMWIAAYKMRQESELLCDELVLAFSGQNENKKYGNIIVNLLESFSIQNIVPGLVGILENKNQIKRRILMIKKGENKSLKKTIISIVLTAIIAGCALINAKELKNDSTSLALKRKRSFKMTVENKNYKSNKERVIHFVHTGAINGNIQPPNGFGGWAAIVGFVNSLRAKDETVFLLDAGDGQWGSGAALVTGGEIPARLANAANYDAILLGNLDVNSSSLKLLNMPLIKGNSGFYKKYGTFPSAVPFTIIKKNGISVGILGALYGVSDRKDPYGEHRKIVRKMKKDKVDLVVLLTHDAKGRDWNEYKKMGVDVVLAHWSQSRAPAKDELIKSTGMVFSYTTGVRKGKNLGHLKLKIGRRSLPEVLLEEQITLDENKIRIDEKVNNIAEKEKLRLDSILSEVVGSATAGVSHSLGSFSPAGQLVLNALKDSTDTEIIVYISSGIRAGLKKGTIKYSNLIDMLPFGNIVVVFELKGSDLQEFASLYNRNVLASGIKFGKVIEVNNKPLDPKRYYSVATCDYLVDRGSGPFKILRNGINKIYHGYVINALRDYIKKNSPIKIETKKQIK